MQLQQQVNYMGSHPSRIAYQHYNQRGKGHSGGYEQPALFAQHQQHRDDEHRSVHLQQYTQTHIVHVGRHKSTEGSRNAVLSNERLKLMCKTRTSRRPTAAPESENREHSKYRFRMSLTMANTHSGIATLQTLTTVH